MNLDERRLSPLLLGSGAITDADRNAIARITVNCSQHAMITNDEIIIGYRGPRFFGDATLTNWIIEWGLEYLF